MDGLTVAIFLAILAAWAFKNMDANQLNFILRLLGMKTIDNKVSKKKEKQMSAQPVAQVNYSPVALTEKAPKKQTFEIPDVKLL